MSMATYEPDREAGDENAYEARPGISDLCAACDDNLVVEGEDMCRSCLDEFQIDAYEAADPKSPTFHERLADYWDMREKIPDV